MKKRRIMHKKSGKLTEKEVTGIGIYLS